MTDDAAGGRPGAPPRPKRARRRSPGSSGLQRDTLPGRQTDQSDKSDGYRARARAEQPSPAREVTAPGAMALPQVDAWPGR
jgi:hypothetical protein